MTIGIAAFLGILLCAVLIWLAFRPKPTVKTPPDEAARQELQWLKSHSSDPQLLSRVSHVVRRYLTRCFGLPDDELTTAEFCRSLQKQEQAGPALADHAARVLRSWDEQKFSPAPPAMNGDPVREAETIIDEGQTRLAELRRQELARATPQTAAQQQA